MVAAEAHKEAQASLDRVDKLPVGTGHVDLSAYLRGTQTTLHVGGTAEYEHRVRKNVSVFGQAFLGTAFMHGNTSLEYGVLGGMRWTF